MQVKNITRLLKKAKEKEQEKVAWDLWSNMYPHMITGHIKSKSFNDFKNELLKQEPNHSNISEEEIEEELNKVIAAYEQKK